MYRALSNCPSVDIVGGGKWEGMGGKLNDRRDMWFFHKGFHKFSSTWFLSAEIGYFT